MKRRTLLALVPVALASVSLILANPGRLAGPRNAGATVSVSNFKFEPAEITVKAGSTVTWRVKEGSHTVTADDGSFQSDNVGSGQSFSHKFAKPGKYPYYCSLHGGKGGQDMAGVVTVTR